MSVTSANIMNIGALLSMLLSAYLCVSYEESGISAREHHDPGAACFAPRGIEYRVSLVTRRNSPAKAAKKILGKGIQWVPSLYRLKILSSQNETAKLGTH